MTMAAVKGKCPHCMREDSAEVSDSALLPYSEPYWLGKSAYGCKYRVEFSPAYTRGVKLGLWSRVKLLLGADLIIAHH